MNWGNGSVGNKNWIKTQLSKSLKPIQKYNIIHLENLRIRHKHGLVFIMSAHDVTMMIYTYGNTFWVKVYNLQHHSSLRYNNDF